MDDVYQETFLDVVSADMRADPEYDGPWAEDPPDWAEYLGQPRSEFRPATKREGDGDVLSAPLADPKEDQ